MEKERFNKTLNLEANKEARIVVEDSSDEVSVELIDGTGEIYGLEMIKNKIYQFTSSFAVVSFQGCTLRLGGKLSQTYTVNHNRNIYDLHLLLEEHRTYAEKNGVKGPVVLIAGPTDVGKSTLTRSLLNYAVRCGRKPLYIDLDVGQSSISIPGTIGILAVDEPGDIVKGFNDAKSSVYYFGYKSPGINILLYYLLIKKLGKTVHKRFKSSKHILSSGAVIDTCGWVTGGGYKSICLAAKSLEVSQLLVLGDKGLYSDLKQDLTNVDVKYIRKLEGVVERSRSVRIRKRDSLIHEYFYGSQVSLHPYKFDVNFSDVQIFQASSASCKVNIDELEDAFQYISPSPVSISDNLLNHVLAVSYADTVDDVILTSVLGFICVIEINMQKQTFTVLSPQPKPLPKNLLLIGDVQYNQKNASKS